MGIMESGDGVHTAMATATENSISYVAIVIASHTQCNQAFIMEWVIYPIVKATATATEKRGIVLTHCADHTVTATDNKRILSNLPLPS